MPTIYMLLTNMWNLIHTTYRFTVKWTFVTSSYKNYTKTISVTAKHPQHFPPHVTLWQIHEGCRGGSPPYVGPCRISDLQHPCQIWGSGCDSSMSRPEFIYFAVGIGEGCTSYWARVYTNEWTTNRCLQLLSHKTFLPQKW